MANKFPQCKERTEVLGAAGLLKIGNCLLNGLLKIGANEVGDMQQYNLQTWELLRIGGQKQLGCELHWSEPAVGIIPDI